jgi:hypothetical protein
LDTGTGRRSGKKLLIITGGLVFLSLPFNNKIETLLS